MNEEEGRGRKINDEEVRGRTRKYAAGKRRKKKKENGR